MTTKISAATSYSYLESDLNMMIGYEYDLGFQISPGLKRSLQPSSTRVTTQNHVLLSSYYNEGFFCC